MDKLSKEVQIIKQMFAKYGPVTLDEDMSMGIYAILKLVIMDNMEKSFNLQDAMKAVVLSNDDIDRYLASKYAPDDILKSVFTAVILAAGKQMTNTNRPYGDTTK